MLKTISPIDNSIFVERPYATSSEIENTLNLSDQTKLKWKNTSLQERKKLVFKFVEDFLSTIKKLKKNYAGKWEDLCHNVQVKCVALKKEPNI